MLSDNLDDEMERDMGGRFKRERTYVYLWLIHADVWQKPIQHRKAITLQLKISKHLKTICSHDG